jgi:hypothetical protein
VRTAICCAFSPPLSLRKAHDNTRARATDASPCKASACQSHTGYTRSDFAPFDSTAAHYWRSTSLVGCVLSPTRPIWFFSAHRLTSHVLPHEPHVGAPPLSGALGVGGGPKGLETGDLTIEPIEPKSAEPRAKIRRTPFVEVVQCCTISLSKTFSCSLLPAVSACFALGGVRSSVSRYRQ